MVSTGPFTGVLNADTARVECLSRRQSVTRRLFSNGVIDCLDLKLTLGGGVLPAPVCISSLCSTSRAVRGTGKTVEASGCVRSKRGGACLRHLTKVSHD